MSRQVSYSDTLVVSPSGIDLSQSSYSTASGNTNAYSDTSSTTYARVNCSTGSRRTSYVTYTFNLSELPENATITSVACSAKASVTSTTYAATATLQLYAGTTAKGSTTSFRNTTAKVYDLSVGDWTAEELATARIRATATRGTSSTSSTLAMYIYGAVLTVNYSVDKTEYTVTATSSANGITISPASQDVLEGNDATVTINGLSSLDEISITDNNESVLSNLVKREPEDAESYYEYTIVNVHDDHVILITGTSTNRAYMKINGEWVGFTKVYKKIDNTWQEQSDFGNIFDSNTIYIKN